MPFDTTYQLYSADPNRSLSVTSPGGIDTVIYLGYGKMPPHVDSTQALLIKSFLYNPVKDEEGHYVPTSNLILVFLLAFIVIVWFVRKEIREEEYEEETDQGKQKAYLTYYGNNFRFKDADIQKILVKHFPYFNGLGALEKERFISRLRKFMAAKFFKIYGSKGFRDMPILISASAIQLSFGLRKYLLPNFNTINIHPREFLRVKPVICLLQGNVSKHAINISWKHFLEGLKDPLDGKNLGLHEMAHALYYQTFVSEENLDTRFRDNFDSFNSYGNKAYLQEQTAGFDLYSDYAMTNFQEFWAESIELFFERPQELSRSYPQLYTALVEILNQDPASFVIQVKAPM